MTQRSYAKAAIPNPALQPFSRLIGEWSTVGSHPMVPDTTLRGHASFEWFENGAFLIMRQAIDAPDFPTGVAIFGSDNATGEFFQLYFDEREVSRKYEVSIEGNVIKWWRNDPEFSQRNTLTIAADGQTLTSKGEMSRNGAAWEPDLELTYTRST